MERPPKNETGKPRDVPEDVREKQDPEYSERDFDDALGRVTKRLDDSSAPPARESRRR